MKVHDKIRLLRKEKDWTQEEMAEKLGMSTLGYAKVERGETDYQSNAENYLSKLAKIANLLNVDLEELIANGDKPIYLVGGGDNNAGFNNAIIGSPLELAFEIQKLQLMLEHKNEIVEQKDKEIAGLKEIIALMKK